MRAITRPRAARSARLSACGVRRRAGCRARGRADPRPRARRGSRGCRRRSGRPRTAARTCRRSACACIAATTSRRWAASLRTGIRTLTSTASGSTTLTLAERVRLRVPSDRSDAPARPTGSSRSRSRCRSSATCACCASASGSSCCACVVCFGVTLIYVSTADKVYEAEADLLVSPAPRDSDSLVGLPIVRESSDPTRDVETVARLVTSNSVARRVRANLDTDRTTRGLLNSVKAEPVAQSNIVAVTASGSSAEEAQELANAFGRAIVEDRTEQLHDQLDQVLAAARVAPRGEPTTWAAPRRRRSSSRSTSCETLRGGPDPTVRLQNPAELPTSPVAPRPLFSTVASVDRRPRARPRRRLRARAARPARAARGPAAPPAAAAGARPRAARGGAARRRCARSGSRRRPSRPTARCARRCRPRVRQDGLALGAGHQPVGLRGQDDDGDQPRRVAGARRPPRDPRRGRPAAPVDRAHARRRAAART